MSEGKKNIIAALLQEYDIKIAEDIQDALKDLLGVLYRACWKLRWINILAMSLMNVLISQTPEIVKNHCNVCKGLSNSPNI